jgi:CIC family chloride channel protein
MNQNSSTRPLILRWQDRLQPSESTLLAIAAVVVGAMAGGGVWLFKRLIDVVHALSFDQLGAALSQWGGWTILLVPIVGGLVVGVLMHVFVGEERHHGVAGIMEAVALAGGRLRYKRAPAKIVASAISIGAGASVGPEDPSVQIGANLGSMFGQLTHLSDDRVRALAAAGAAAGIAAAFNAPIAGVFFALEIVLGELSGNTFGAVVVASVSSAVLTQALSGPQPAFHVPQYAFTTIQELPLYLGLGLLAGPVSVFYIRGLYKAQDLFHAWSAPRWVKPAAAGLLVGLTGIFLPQIFGVGYDTIEKILADAQFGIMLLLALLVFKLLMTSISIGGGFPGGVFAPSLYLGAVLGAAYGLIMQQVFPSLGIAPPSFAMVGMAAVLAGTVHSPITAIILLFEMTNDYRIILPLMFAVVVSLVISQKMQRDSIYTLGLARKGIRLQRGRDVEVLEAISVGEIMQTEVTTLRESDPLKVASDTLMRSRHHGLPVVDAAGKLVGMLTVQDLDRAQTSNGKADVTIGEACTRELLVTYPDETIGTALRRMAVRDIGRLPVVSRDDPSEMVGLLRRTDLVRAYDVALTRRAAMRHRAQQVRLGTFDGVSVEEITISPDAPCADKRVSEVRWPRDCVLATLRRGRQVFLPHGDTILRPGDVLVAVAEGEARQQVRQLCLGDQVEARHH